jgi:hypothetical protein
MTPTVGHWRLDDASARQDVVSVTESAAIVGDKDFFERARVAVGNVTQAELGEKLGVSKRTAQRYSDKGVPPHYLKELARLVHPFDVALAAEIAGSMGHTLESLGVVAPPAPAPPPVVVVEAPPPPPPPPPPLPPPPPPPDGIVDAVVCAAAEAMEMMPRDVRPGLLAAFKRAREIGVTVDMVERVLLASIPAPQVTVAVAPAGKRKT